MHRKKIGLIGLGIMGSAMASNLLKSGFKVVGYDLLSEKSNALEAMGGEIACSSGEVAEKSDVLITSLPSDAALHDVALGRQGVSENAKKGMILIETSTLTLEAKEEAYQGLQRAGIDMIDAPLNGTAIHAVRKEIVVFASGNKKACETCAAIFDGFSRKTYYLGEFGMGTRMKFINNLLITVHKVATAEALVLGMKAGMEPALIHEVICDGAASSRMFEVKGALMVNGTYDEPMMKIDLFLKDIRNITAFAHALRCPTPLLAAATQFFTAASANGWGMQDTASVCSVLEEMAGFKRKTPGMTSSPPALKGLKKPAANMKTRKGT